MDKQEVLFGIPVQYVFFLYALLLFCVPGYMIYREETNLREGTAYRFRVEPVDPVDPFRGRFVDLRFSAARVSDKGISERFSEGNRGYAVVVEGNDGYATFRNVVAEPPPDEDYVAVQMTRFMGDEVILDVPFDRYYMAEEKAKEANRVVRELAGNDEVPVWARVLVRDGDSTLETVFVGETPLEEYISGKDTGK